MHREIACQHAFAIVHLQGELQGRLLDRLTGREAQHIAAIRQAHDLGLDVVGQGLAEQAVALFAGRQGARRHGRFAHVQQFDFGAQRLLGRAQHAHRAERQGVGIGGTGQRREGYQGLGKGQRNDASRTLSPKDSIGHVCVGPSSGSRAQAFSHHSYV